MPTKVDIESILLHLTQEEKISLLAGANFSGTTAIPGKGVPAIKAVDGPNGVRSAATDESVRSACFPAACSLAATFDPQIAYQTGRALAVEARGKGAHCLLGPTVCIHRHPLGGRNFESFSEDPFLTGKLASQYIQGLRSLGISATIKHFVANEQETQRTTVDETISERALREIYLRPFEIAVKEATPWAIMTAYNSVNGTHCDNHGWLLQQILRGEWAWDGLVMSDWGGTNSVASALKAGLDLEMPGPPKIRKMPAMLDVLETGEVSSHTLDDRVRAVLNFALKLKANEDEVDPATIGASTDTPELRAMLRDSAARGMVLLKNEGDILPLVAERLRGKKIALIGFSKDALAHGGGSASVNSYYKVAPWDALHEALGHAVEFTFAAGAHQGSEEPTKVSHGQTQSAYSPLGSQESLWRALEIIGDFKPVESGDHYIACSGLGPTRVYIDDIVVFEQAGNSTDPMGSLFLAAPEVEIQHMFEAGKTYRIRIRSDPPVKIGLEILEGRSGVRVGFALESVHDADLQGEAARVAEAADLAIVFTGHDPQWETEGRDQDSFDLPCGQNELITAVADANPNLIVVNSTGVAISMPWISRVKGLIQAWFPGQECGNGIADVLTGVVNPEGRLPVSFPRRIEDAPAHGNFPGDYVDGKLMVSYEEGVFVGYRHFDRLDRSAVNFPFGFGLSYTTFELINLEAVPATNDPSIIDVTVDVKNTGGLAGRTLVQLYVGRLHLSVEQPAKSLVGFQKLYLVPGETTSAHIRVETRDFAYFDENLKHWLLEGGEYAFSVGTSAADLVHIVEVSLERRAWAP